MMQIKRLFTPVLFCFAVACLIEIPLGMTDLFGEDVILWDTLFRTIGAVPVLLWFYREDVSLRGKIRFDVRLGLMLFVAGAMLSAGARFLFLMLGIPGYVEETRSLFTGNQPLQFVVLLVASPLLEEMFFRGVLFMRLKEVVSGQSAVSISAVCFGLYHGNLSQGIYGFFMGIVLAWAMEHCRTVAGPLVLHVGANVAAVLLELL